MRKTTKKSRFKLTENLVITGVCVIMKNIFFIAFLTNIFYFVKYLDLLYLLGSLVSFYYSFFWWKFKINYHKHLIDSYVETFENHPLKNASRSTRRAVIRYFKKNPLKV